jgi:(S)-mandelate dehydrogenase
MPWRRRPFRDTNLSRALNISHLREIASRSVPHFVFEYVEGGSEDEASLRNNRSAFESYRFVPQTLVDTTARHHRTQLFGSQIDAPLVIAPTGMNGILRQDGDLLLASAPLRPNPVLPEHDLDDAARKNCVGSRRAAVDAALRDEEPQGRGEHRLPRARGGLRSAGVHHRRERVRPPRMGPPQLPAPRPADDPQRARHAAPPPLATRCGAEQGRAPVRELRGLLPPGGASAIGGSTIIPTLFSPDITWDDIAWLRGIWDRKLLIKGVLSVADAERAAALGCDGIILTNHGGRQLDSCVAPFEMVPEISAAVGNRMTVVVDSGFRRGADVVKALALGANAVMIGRATLYGLTAGGEPGVRRALEILTSEIDRVLGQLGVRSLEELGPHLLRKS